MPNDKEKMRIQKPRWRPSRWRKENRFRRPIDVYFQKHPGLTVNALRSADPRLLEAIDLSGELHLIAGEAPKKYQDFVAAYDAAFTIPGTNRKKKTMRPRRFGRELLDWLTNRYPDSLPFPEQLKHGDLEERQLYQDLKDLRLLPFLIRFLEQHGPEDPVARYNELCERKGRIITRAQLKKMVAEGGRAIFSALERRKDPDDPSRTLLEKHVPVLTDKVSLRKKS